MSTDKNKVKMNAVEQTVCLYSTSSFSKKRRNMASYMPFTAIAAPIETTIPDRSLNPKYSDDGISRVTIGTISKGTALLMMLPKP